MQNSDMPGPSNSPRTNPPSDASVFPREELFVLFTRLSLTDEPINHLLGYWADDSTLRGHLVAAVECALSTELVAQLGALMTAPRRQHREEVIAAHVHNWVLDRLVGGLPTQELDVIAALLIRAMAPQFDWDLIEPRFPDAARERE